MEEQPSYRATEIVYHRHGDEKSSCQPKGSLNNVHCHRGFQHQETQTTKTGNGKINCASVEGERALSENDSVGMPCSPESNGSSNLLNTNLKLKTTDEVTTNHFKVGDSGHFSHHTNSMDGKHGKTSDAKHHEVKALDKKEPMLSFNGVVPLSPSHVTNGYSTKAAADNDGSGSESGYMTPKRRKARRSSTRIIENKEKEKSVQRGNPAFSKQEFDSSSQLEATGKVATSQSNSTRTCLKEEGGRTGVRRTGTPEASPAGEAQRKNSDGKASSAVVKKTDEKLSKAKFASSVTSKEDTWTLFKPPPVFPVDNSSAKIVPKISYASKVKENLNKTAQAIAEAPTPPPQVSVRVTHVPMSAVKTITSISLTNGPVSGDGTICLSGGTFFNSAASRATSGSPKAGGENVASVTDNNSSSSAKPTVPEPGKSSVSVYPLNMQPELSSAHQEDSFAPQTNQKTLGDIFQNQWGLSFIIEPNAGPDGAVGRPTVEIDMAEVTFQGDSGDPVILTQTSPDISPSLPPPSVNQSQKRTISPSSESSKARRPSDPAGETVPQSSGQGEQKGDGGNPAASETVSCNDLGADASSPPPADSGRGPCKAQVRSGARERAGSWGSFDLRAAVLYHAKEFENVFALQKRDPKRVVFYDASMDSLDQ